MIDFNLYCLAIENEILIPYIKFFNLLIWLRRLSGWSKFYWCFMPTFYLINGGKATHARVKKRLHER